MGFFDALFKIPELMQEKQRYDKEQQWKIIQQQREDTTYQRAVEDLRKAGLSPTLAAGGQAPVGNYSVKTDPANFKMGNLLEEMQSAQNIDLQRTQQSMMKQDMSNRRNLALTQTDLMSAQTNQINQMLQYQQFESTARARAALAQAGLSVAQQNRLVHDLNVSQEQGTVTQPGIIGGALRDVGEFLDRLQDISNPPQQHGGSGNY